MRSDFAQKINIIKIHKPVGIIYHYGLISAEIYEAFHLSAETGNIVIDRFTCHHFTHIRLARRIPDHAGSASEKGNRFISCHLQPFHQAQGHKMTDMQAVRCRVEPNIESSFAGIHQLSDGIFVSYLGDQTACL